MVDSPPPQQFRRRVAAVGAVAATVPYVALKVLWLSGNLVGVPADSPAAGDEFVYANAITFGMDAFVVVLALALTQRWGMRVPAWLLLAPVWVGTGLLVPAVLQAAAGGLAWVVSGGQAMRLEGGLVEPWVYAVVGASFALQGIFLAAAFWWYARARWSHVFQPAEPAKGATDEVQTVFVRGGGGAAVVIAIGYAVWQFGDAGPFGEYEPGWEVSQRMHLVIAAATALVAAIGAARMLRPTVRVPFGRAAVLAWVGSGSLCGWGLYQVVVVLSGASLTEDVSPVGNLMQLTSMLAGFALALGCVLRIVERRVLTGADQALPQVEPRPKRRLRGREAGFAITVPGPRVDASPRSPGSTSALAGGVETKPFGTDPVARSRQCIWNRSNTAVPRPKTKSRSPSTSQYR